MVKEGSKRWGVSTYDAEYGYFGCRPLGQWEFIGIPESIYLGDLLSEIQTKLPPNLHVRLFHFHRFLDSALLLYPIS
jgi:hypothetical protein